jgi:hypothetical protein
VSEKGFQPAIQHQPNDGAVMAPKPPLFPAPSSGFIVPLSIGQSLRFEESAYVYLNIRHIEIYWGLGLLA